MNSLEATWQELLGDLWLEWKNAARFQNVNVATWWYGECKSRIYTCYLYTDIFLTYYMLRSVEVSQ